MHEHWQHNPGHSLLSVLIPLVMVGAILIVYLAALWALHRARGRWNSWRTISFSTGIILLGVALSPSLVQWAYHDMRGHMVQHLLIGMVAPLGLVMGAPVTLAMKTMPRQTARLVTRMLGSSLFHVLSHPVTALVLNIGGMFVLYLSPLYNAAAGNPVLHHLIHLHFLAAGYLFTWAIAGPDPAPRRPGIGIRVVVLFISIAAHAYLSKCMYAYLYPLYSGHSADEIRSAARLMYYGGDLSELLLAIALFSVWYGRTNHPRYQKSFLFS